MVVAGIALAVLAGGVANACPAGSAAYRPDGAQLELCWTAIDGVLDVQASHPGEVWIGIGFGREMVGAAAVIGHPRRNAVDQVVMTDRSPDAMVPAVPPVAEATVGFEAGVTRLRLRRPIAMTAKIPLLWAVGEEPDFAGHLQSGVVEFDPVHGSASAASPPWWVAAHAVAMAIAWGVLLPLGVLMARFFKVTRDQDYPRQLDNRFWWTWHRILQYCGIGVMTAGALLATMSTTAHLSSAHAVTGAVGVALGLLQVAAGWLRGSKGGPLHEKTKEPMPRDRWRGDHYDMTVRRRVFEAVHKTGGYMALAVALGALALGLSQSGAPTWACVAALAPWAIIAALFVHYTRQGRRVPTYQAIWGPSPEHPGNRTRADEKGARQLGGVRKRVQH